MCVCSVPLHLAHSSLDDGIKASLRGISVPGHHLLLHFLGEAAHLLRQSQHVFVAKLRQAGRVYAVSEKTGPAITPQLFRSVIKLLKAVGLFVIY